MTVQIIRISELTDEYGLIGLSALAGAMRLANQSVREFPVEPRFRGNRTDEAKYRLKDVIDHLRDLNPDKHSVWSDHLLRPSEAANWLSENGRLITANALAKRRMRHQGPSCVKITLRTLRYREDDLMAWLAKTAEKKC